MAMRSVPELRRSETMTKTGRLVVLVVICTWAVTAVYAGGWSVITLEEFPDHAVAGQPLTLTFTVRQHGNKPQRGLKPTLQATLPGHPAVAAIGKATAGDGEYSATLRLPVPGQWKIRIDGGFNPSDKTRESNSMVLPPLRVLAETSAAVVSPYSEADRGARLAVSKGCLTCHRPGSDKEIPTKSYATAYLKAFLADPGMRTENMPNLKLTDAEIGALVAFINGPRGPRATALTSRQSAAGR
jgi:hypothetical protein